MSHLNTCPKFGVHFTLRSVLQTLARIASTDPIENPQAYAHEFGQAMIAMSLQNLYQANIAVDELVAENFHALTETVFEIAMKDGDPDTSAYLRPTSAEVHNRSAMFGLSAAVAQQLRGKPGTCLTYLLRGPGMVKLMHDAIDSNKRYLEEDVLNREFRRYMGPGRRDDALGWSRLASAALVAEYASNPPNRFIRSGIIGLNQNGGNDFNSFHAVFKYLSQRNTKYPAAAFSLVNLSGSGTKTLASIYNILGLMGKLLALTEQTAWKSRNASQQEDDVFDQLLGFFPNTNSVALPVWVKSQVAVSEVLENALHLKDDQKKSIQAWANPLRNWLVAAADLKTLIAPSSVMVGKVMPRLFYGLENISDALRINTSAYSTEFASAMELFALCVVNAFLAEESAYHLPDNGDPKRIILDNPRTSAVDYLKRLEAETDRVGISSASLPLTHIIATCPLITGLIRHFTHEDHKETATQNTTSELESKPKKNKPSGTWPFNINSFKPDTFISTFHWNHLNKIAIAGKKE